MNGTDRVASGPRDRGRRGRALYLAGLGIRRRSPLALLGMVAVIVLAAAALVAGASLQRGAAGAFDRAAARAGHGDVTVWGRPAALRAAAALPAVRRAGALRPLAGAELVTADGTTELVLVEAIAPSQPVAAPLLRTGRMPALDGSSIGEAAVEPGLGVVGDRLRLRWLGRTAELRVVGSAVDFADCSAPTCRPGHIFVSTATFATAFGDPRTSDAMRTLQLRNPAEELAPRGDGPVFSRTLRWTALRTMLLSPEAVLGGFGTGLGVFLLLGAMVTVFSTVSVQMIARRRELAVLGTLGASTAELTLGLLVEQLALAATGSLLGWLLGSLAAPLAQATMARSLGWGGAVFRPWLLLVVTVSVCGSMLAVTAVSAVRAARRPLVAELRDEPVVGRPVARWAGRLPGTVLPFAVREPLSRKLRSVSVLLGVALAASGAITAQTLRHDVVAAAKPDHAISDHWDLAVWSMTATPTDALASEIERVPGVRSTHTSNTVEGQLLDAGTGDGAVPLRVTVQGGDPSSTSVHVIAGRLPTRPGEVLIGTGLARRRGVGLDDRIRFRVHGHDFADRVVGTYRDFGGGMAVRLRLEELRTVEPRASAGTLQVVLVPGADRRRVLRVVQQRLGPRAQAFAARGLGAEARTAATALGIVGLLVVLLALGAIGSAWLVGVREHRRHLGLLRVAGCTDATLAAQSGLAAALVAACGCVVAWPLATGAHRVITERALARLQSGGEPVPSPSMGTVLVVSIALLAACGALGAWSAWSVARTLRPHDLTPA